MAEQITDAQILSLAYDVGAMPEQMTDAALYRFARALLEFASPPVAVQEERDAALPEPAFRLTWKGERAAYYVSKPGIDSTDCYTAEQMRQQFNSGREFEAQRAAMKGDQP